MYIIIKQIFSFCFIKINIDSFNFIKCILQYLLHTSQKGHARDEKKTTFIFSDKSNTVANFINKKLRFNINVMTNITRK